MEISIKNVEHGVLVTPQCMPNPVPGIVFLHGSEGGWGDYWSSPSYTPKVGLEGNSILLAKTLAKSCFAVLHAPYFHSGEYKHLKRKIPEELVNVPLESTFEALDWLKSQTYISKVGLLGASRGGERAFLVNSYLRVEDQPSAMVAISPSLLSFTGIDKSHVKDLKKGLEPNWDDAITSWTLNKTAIPTWKKIDIELIENPVLYIYFKRDPAWGKDVQVQTIKPFIENINKKVNESLVSEIGFPDIPIIKQIDWTGIAYNFEGHCLPNKEKYPDYSSKQLNVIIDFFKLHLS